jgi:PKD repeat protein
MKSPFIVLLVVVLILAGVIIILPASESTSSLKTYPVGTIGSSPAAGFTASTTSGQAPLLVKFTDTSGTINPTAFLWTFGDGGTSTSENPSYTYNIPGVYNITFKITNSTGVYTMTGYETVLREVPTYGTHPYIYFHNITQTPGWQNQKYAPWSSYQSTIHTNANAAFNLNLSSTSVSSSTRAKDARDAATWYHICSNSGGTGCINYADISVTIMQAMSPQFRYERDKSVPTYHQSDTNLWEGSDAAGALMNYAIAYDLLEDSNSSGHTTLIAGSTNDSAIRDNLAFWMNDSYINLFYYNGVYNANGEQHWDDETAVELLYAVAYQALPDYDTTGKNLESGPTQWSSLMDQILLVNGTPLCTVQACNPGMFYIIANNTGMFIDGSYESYWYGNYAYYPPAYSNIYGNIFTENPGMNEFALSHIMSALPNTIWSDYQTMTGWGVDMLSTSRFPANEAPWFNWYLENNPAEWRALESHPADGWYYPDYWISYMAQSNITGQAAYPPTSLHWITPTFAVLRSAWNENANWISMSYRPAISTTSNRFDNHLNQLSVEDFSHGDDVLPEDSEIKYTPGIYDQTSGVDGVENVMMIGKGTVSFPPETFVAGGITYPQDNLTSRGVGSISSNDAEIGTTIDTPSLGYVSATVDFTKTIDNIKLQAPILWTRAIIAPDNEYFVVVDRATSTVGWQWKSHWNLGSWNGANPQSVEVNRTPPWVNGAQTEKGTLTIAGHPWTWTSPPQPFAVETDTGYVTNSVVWNTTNERGIPISTQIFSAPAADVSYFTQMDRDGGYSSPVSATNHEWQNPHIFFNSPGVQTSVTRVTALLTSWATGSDKYTPSELPVTGNGAAIKILPPPGHADTVDVIYSGHGTSSFGTMSTDADTTFYRRNLTSGMATDYMIINGSYINDGGTTFFQSSVPLGYIAVNRTSSGIYTVNMSGSTGGGSATLAFATMTGTPTAVSIDGMLTTNWHMSGSTLNVTTPLSAKMIQFDSGRD